MSTPVLSYTDLAIGSLLIVINAGLSVAMHLGLARALFIAGVRSVVQLLLIGLILKTVFALESPYLVAAVVTAMFATASYEILSRQERRFSGWWGLGIGTGSAMLATLFVTAFAMFTMRPEPWYSPQVVIPLVGIVLGSVMNGVAISLNAFNTGVVRERSAIETRLALGDSKYRALKSLQQGALKSGMIPIINQMSAAGIITLPGMMTGQILAGMAPFEAAKYQILILFLLAGAAGLGAYGALYLAVWRVTDERDRLRLDRLRQD